MMHTNRFMMLAFAWVFSIASGGCDGAETATGASSGVSSGASADAVSTARTDAPFGRGLSVVQVTATHDHASEEHGFTLSAEDVASGWTTIAFNNATHADHFVLASNVPGDVGLDEYREEVAYVAQNYLDLINGLPPAERTYPEAGLDFPTWYDDVVFMGGPGLTAPGRTTRATMYLEPGTYILECYVKTEDARYWHHVRGMLAELTVTEERSRAKEPRSTLQLTLRNPEGGGIDAGGAVRPGRHTIAVHFAEQRTYDTGAQNDVHLVRLEEDTNLEELAAWMNPFDPAGFVSPGAPAEFLGGLEDMPEGATGYFTAHLVPGRYAWISEVPDPARKGMLKPFTVASPQP